MESKHTPGPWTICGNGILTHPVSGRELQTTVIEADSWGRIFDIYDYSNEPEYNARLIAAAPELLEACQTFLGIWSDRARLHPDVAMAVGAAERAIAKAQGK